MTDKPKPCPRCGCTVSDAVTYIFIPYTNLRWHTRCYREIHPEVFEKQKEEETQ